jgi:GntR family galactonate operon transcriptional repressor
MLQGFRGAIDTILSTVFLVAVGSVGWFKDNLPNHAAAARAIGAGNADKARIAIERVLGYTKFKLSNNRAAVAAAARKTAGTAPSVKTKSVETKRKRYVP